jgi:1-acyl-sn-glycerol-3-phosphate acyltransferase
MELAGHLWGIFKHGVLDVAVYWGEPVRVEAATDRKVLTRHLEREVRALTMAALRQKPVERFDSDEIDAPEFFSNAEKTAKAGA